MDENLYRKWMSASCCFFILTFSVIIIIISHSQFHVPVCFSFVVVVVAASPLQ